MFDNNSATLTSYETIVDLGENVRFVPTYTVAPYYGGAAHVIRVSGSLDGRNWAIINPGCTVALAPCEMTESNYYRYFKVGYGTPTLELYGHLLNAE